MRTFILALVAATGLAGCAYKSTYRRTNFDTDPKPVAAQKVKVARSADDLVSQYTELGRYTGRAPTVKEAMDQAKQWCGHNGGDLYVLSRDPGETAFGRWQVDGTCALIDPSTTPEHIKAQERKEKREARKKKNAQKKAQEQKQAKKAGAKKKKKKKAAQQ